MVQEAIENTLITNRLTVPELFQKIKISILEQTDEKDKINLIFTTNYLRAVINRITTKLEAPTNFINLLKKPFEMIKNKIVSFDHIKTPEILVSPQIIKNKKR